MAETSGMAEIRGLDVEKLLKGFSDEEIIFKRFVTVTPTSAREIRWYQKTSGYLDTTDTTGMTTSRMANVPQLAQPESIEQSITRQTDYVKKYMVDSPVISMEDMRDADIDILAMNIRDIVRGISRQVDSRIWEVLTEGRIAATTTGLITVSGGWATGGATANIIKDALRAKQTIRAQGYDPEGAQWFMNSTDHTNMMNWLINQAGSNIPAYTSAMIREPGVAMNILGLNVVVSENVTSNYNAVAQTKRAVTWKTFTPITSTTIVDPGIGTKIRCWEEGEAILTDPKAVCLLSGSAA